jgi:hypothetical protein
MIALAMRELVYSTAHHLPPEGLGVSLPPPGLFLWLREFRARRRGRVDESGSMRPKERDIAGVVIAACVFAPLVACAPGAQAVPGESPAERDSVPAERPVEVAPGLVADRAAREVRIVAEVACDRGWLEQAVCKAGTREHESLLVVESAPSAIHAALLLVGARPGSPGGWTQAADGAVSRVAPSGDPLSILVRGAFGEVPLSDWIEDPVSGRAFPADAWVFAGSRMRPNTRSMGPGEHYVADRTGSVVGIVTFGDETVAFREVLPDRAEVEAPAWQARAGRLPAPGTRVELVIRPRGRGSRP